MRIINFGSLNMDHVYQVREFVQPGETISAESLTYFLGGKGLNQSIAIARAGGQVYHAGCIGNDGAELKETLAKYNVNIQHLHDVDLPNGHAIIQVNQAGQNCIVIYGGSNRALSRELVDEALSHFGTGDLLLLQNETNLIEYIAQKANRLGIDVAFNPSPIDEHLVKQFPFEMVRYLLINEVEGQALSGQAEPQEMLNWLHSRYPNTSVVLTVGKKGVLYIGPEGRLSNCAYDMPVVDTTGAGDTFTGYLLAGVAAGKPMQQCLTQASVASSISVSRQGASSSIPTREEVDAFIATIDSAIPADESMQ